MPWWGWPPGCAGSPEPALRRTPAAGRFARPPVNRPFVSTAYFLLNTEWGQPGPESYLALEFDGDKGARYERKLVGGVDVRDYHDGVYDNTVNRTTTRQVFDDGGGQRIDLVEVAPPEEFTGQSLQTIAVGDTGRFNFQRAILWAVTVR